ncbi:MAG: hypothetical protein V2A65_05510 [Candidatus Omnitrophota bacterium]
MKRINGQQIQAIIRNNWGLKILALMVAIFVWFYVCHIEINFPNIAGRARQHNKK